jgi:hypothetical protein
MLGVFVVLVVLLLVFVIWSSQADKPTGISTVQQNEPSQRISYIPPLQRSFTSMVESFVPRYNVADTQIRKTNVRFERRDAIVRYFSGQRSLHFQRWAGEVHDLKTETDGKASLSIKLDGSDTVIQTWNNSLSDSASDTMISRADDLYSSLADIKNGDEVTVSGTFIVEFGAGPDYVRESSLTESGSMTSPEFIVKFSQIGTGAPTDSATSYVSPPAPSEDAVRPAQVTQTLRPVPTINDGGRSSDEKVIAIPADHSSVSSAAADTDVLTGVYSGTAHNTKAKLSAAFGVTIQQQDNALSGCMVVHRPLYGSGKLSGTLRALQITFDVPSSIGVIRFTGNKEGDSLTGTYYVVQSRAVQSYGEFELHRQAELPTDFNSTNCPDDAAVN